MSNRFVFWISFAGLAFCALIYIWFILNFDRIAYEARTSPQREALRNPYLAAQRLLQQLGYRTQTAQEAANLDRLPPGGSIVLTAERQFHMTPARVDSLFRWVEAGGYLIADADRVSGTDPILQRLNVRPRSLLRKEEEAKADTQPKADDDEDDEEEEKRQRAKKLKVSQSREPTRSVVAIPGYGRSLRMRSGGRQLYAGRVVPEWTVHGEAETGKEKRVGEEVLHYRIGRGHVTLVSGLWRFSNYAISLDDHGEILAALFAIYQPKGEVRIMTRLDVPSLWRWLADNAQAALASAALLLAFWLWRIIPRFGVLRAEPAPQRRSLIEHLRAVGRFLWRRGALEVMLDAARNNVLARIALRHAALAGLPSAELAAQLARQTGISGSAIALALGGGVREPEHYTAAIKTLRDLEQKL